MNFVLDASVALAWCFEDEGGDYADGVLDALRTSEAIAASLWPLEVANGLLTAERRGRVEAGEAASFGRLLLALPIVIDPVARSRAFEATRAAARTHALSAYDAAYLELAVRLGVPLATLDERLGRAAEAEGVARWAG
ncbi:MAG TPA: type II toxin-antitoxin system VapC family toxin [Longimicrobiales bacterium]|nr:type II toxin-antitoxin system VapC family toxin [Longimicrobiales bacterium]